MTTNDVSTTTATEDMHNIMEKNDKELVFFALQSVLPANESTKRRIESIMENVDNVAKKKVKKPKVESESEEEEESDEEESDEEEDESDHDDDSDYEEDSEDEENSEDNDEEEKDSENESSQSNGNDESDNEKAEADE